LWKGLVFTVLCKYGDESFEDLCVEIILVRHVIHHLLTMQQIKNRLFVNMIESRLLFHDLFQLLEGLQFGLKGCLPFEEIDDKADQGQFYRVLFLLLLHHEGINLQGFLVIS
jgi:hypothetical protein